MNKILSIQTLGFPWQTQDPFLFCAYHRDEYPSGDENMGIDRSRLQGRNIGQDFMIKDGYRMYHGRSIPGFPYHPHRGFETITINMEGVVDHTDSLGAAGRFMEGDVQWMTAGRGVQHSEMFPLLHDDKKNSLEIFQIWLNLPKASKMVDPHFKMLWKEDIPQITHIDTINKKTIIRIIAGAIRDTKAVPSTPDSWAANPDNAVGIYTIKMDAHASWTLPSTQSEAHRSIYYYKGSEMRIDGQDIPSGQSINVVSNEDIDIQNGGQESYMLLLEGKPINEPVVQHGPFVMNSQEEIEQTFVDYQRSKFGGWPWGKAEMVHSRTKGRFALHSDGTEEIK